VEHDCSTSAARFGFDGGGRSRLDRLLLSIQERRGANEFRESSPLAVRQSGALQPNTDNLSFYQGTRGRASIAQDGRVFDAASGSE
jgi:hypothetical protein